MARQRRKWAADRIRGILKRIETLKDNPTPAGLADIKELLDHELVLMAKDEVECLAMDRLVTMVIGAAHLYPAAADLTKQKAFVKDPEIFDWCVRTAHEIRNSQHEDSAH